MKEELIENLDTALDRLRKIWDEIGIVGEQRKDRTQVYMWICTVKRNKSEKVVLEITKRRCSTSILLKIT